MEARLGQGDTRDVTAQAWRTALDPEGEWIPAVFRAADIRLGEVRHTMPDAGGLVIASDHVTAKAYARIMESITGERVTLVLSDEKAASDRIDAFASSERRWMVAVRMVSEGVDVPRLGVGVYATSASTPLYFAQAIGRFVRARRRGETASIFLPSVPSLTALATAMDLERDHALDRESGEEFLQDDLLASAERDTSASDHLQDEFSYKALASDANFDRVLYDGTEFGFAAEVGSEEERDFIGLPGLLEPDQVRELLLHRQSRQSRHAAERKRARIASGEPEPQNVPLYRTLKEQRTLLNSLVSIWAKSSNQPHGIVHAELRRICGGPAVAQASVAQLQARITRLRHWIDATRH
jgi:superfamily II DNA or RNA helicase